MGSMEVEAKESTLSPKLGDVEARRIRRQRRRQRANMRVQTSATSQVTAPAETPVSAAQLEARLLDVSSAAGQLSESDGSRRPSNRSHTDASTGS